MDFRDRKKQKLDKTALRKNKNFETRKPFKSNMNKHFNSSRSMKKMKLGSKVSKGRRHRQNMYALFYNKMSF